MFSLKPCFHQKSSFNQKSCFHQKAFLPKTMFSPKTMFLTKTMFLPQTMFSHKTKSYVFTKNILSPKFMFSPKTKHSPKTLFSPKTMFLQKPLVSPKKMIGLMGRQYTRFLFSGICPQLFQLFIQKETYFCEVKSEVSSASLLQEFQSDPGVNIRERRGGWVMGGTRLGFDANSLLQIEFNNIKCDLSFISISLLLLLAVLLRLVPLDNRLEHDVEHLQRHRLPVLARAPRRAVGQV